jgi:hypothetical protein
MSDFLPSLLFLFFQKHSKTKTCFFQHTTTMAARVWCDECWEAEIKRERKAQKKILMQKEIAERKLRALAALAAAADAVADRIAAAAASAVGDDERNCVVIDVCDHERDLLTECEKEGIRCEPHSKTASVKKEEEEEEWMAEALARIDAEGKRVQAQHRQWLADNELAVLKEEVENGLETQLP